MTKLEKLQLSIYNIEEIKKLFKLNKKIIAYGNGKFYKEVKNVLENEKLFFNDIYFTDKGKIKSKLEDTYINSLKDTIIIICSSFNTEIINTINKQKQKPFKVVTLNISKNNKYHKLYKEHLSLKMQLKHFELLKELKGKKKIKVVFLAIHKSVWKVDPVFKKMLDDPFFDPLILVCPYTPYGEERMWQDMEEAYEYFEGKGYPVLSSYNKKQERWLTLDEIKPDIVFFTNPHGITRKEYYEDAYLNYLSCYCGYGMPISKYSNYQEQFNQYFHNAVWKIFVQTQEMVVNYEKYSSRNGLNIHLVGDNIVEQLNKKNLVAQSQWKDDSQRKKIIYAPHHTIMDNEQLSLGTFIEHSEHFRILASQNKEQVYWSFKPHPILKSKLYLHPKWGKERTDAYYKFWQDSEFSQLDEGEYLELFINSDALILDSSSFLGEYLFTQKPMLYLMKNNVESFMSQFGLLCLKACYQANLSSDIGEFVNRVIQANDPSVEKRKNVIRVFKENIGREESTSTLIFELIKSEFDN